MGCVLGELIACQEDFYHNHIRGQPLFPSSSSFPLSPAPGKEERDKPSDKVEELDLTRMILKILGDQRSKDLSFLTSSKAKRFVRNLNPDS
mmetsp:Transcript_9048/g.13818  ORF Transcript_9048/g.13818 Transcript_9048/m.13818 type:complete len:91 (-) Transcript_9048:370-642(-)